MQARLVEDPAKRSVLRQLAKLQYQEAARINPALPEAQHGQQWIEYETERDLSEQSADASEQTDAEEAEPTPQSENSTGSEDSKPADTES
jgi:hypothetical protein